VFPAFLFCETRVLHAWLVGCGHATIQEMCIERAKSFAIEKAGSDESVLPEMHVLGM
jgi:hypothetical protein